MTQMVQATNHKDLYTAENTHINKKIKYTNINVQYVFIFIYKICLLAPLRVFWVLCGSMCINIQWHCTTYTTITHINQIKHTFNKQNY